MTTSTEIDYSDPAVLVAIAEDPKVAVMWTAYQEVRQARAAGVVAGGPRHAELAEAAARRLWVEAVREAAGIEVAR